MTVVVARMVGVISNAQKRDPRTPDPNVQVKDYFFLSFEDFPNIKNAFQKAAHLLRGSSDKDSIVFPLISTEFQWEHHKSNKGLRQNFNPRKNKFQNRSNPSRRL